MVCGNKGMYLIMLIIIFAVLGIYLILENNKKGKVAFDMSLQSVQRGLFLILKDLSQGYNMSNL